MSGHGAANGAAETYGLSRLGARTTPRFDSPDAAILEAFPNRNPERDYVVVFDYPEFTSLCPVTGQPDYGAIRVTYVPDACCVESKSFKLYMTAFRNSAAFMEELTNRITGDLILLLKPRRMTVEGRFNARGGTSITVRVEHFDSELPPERQERLSRLVGRLT
ncbi:MAG: preQ(1) synthase [Desulfovibrio sp.]|jgi:7-cyano-7-deazaguanine reductase|nr:preQ(1) synthase [Desulfovibrio sp.]